MNSRLLTILTAVLSIIGIVLCVFVFRAGEDEAVLSGPVGNIVTYSLILLGIAVAVAIIGSFLGMFKNPKGLKNALFGIVGLAVVLIVSYLIANSDQVVDANEKIIAAAGSSVSKLTSAGIWVSTILLVVGAVFFIVDLLKGLVKS